MLSLPLPGDVVKMLKVVEPSKLDMMSPETLQDFFDYACVPFDFSRCRSWTEPQRRAKARLLERSQNPDKAQALCAMLPDMRLQDFAYR